MRKVAILLDSFRIGGTERQFTNLIKYLSKEKFEVFPCALRSKGPLLKEVQETRHDVHEFRIRSFMGPSFLQEAVRLGLFLQRRKIEVLQTTDFYSNLLGFVAGRLVRGVRIITSRRDLGTYLSKRKLWIQSRLCSRSERIVVNSQTVKRHVIEKEKITAQKVVVVYNGVDVTPYSYHPGDGRVWRELGLDRFSPVIIMVANMNHPVKGQKVLLDAAPAILKNFIRAGFLFVGDGALRCDYEEYARSIGVITNTVFAGSRNDVPSLLRQSDISVVCSYSEGFPNSILESMAAGTPVVAADADGSREALEGGRTGILFPSGNWVALSEKVQELGENRELRDEIARKGRKAVSERYSVERMVEQMEAVYNSL